MVIEFVKAHAYGNDFVFMSAADVPTDAVAEVARAVCNRQTGIGADGLILFQTTPHGASMTLLNADGSHAEVSGNGVRCLGAILVEGTFGGIDDTTDTALSATDDIIVETDGGVKTLTLLDQAEGVPRYIFRVFMGEPEGLRQFDLEVSGEPVRVVALSIGNPQCIVLTDHLDEAQFHALGPKLAAHEAFSDGTNVEFVEVENTDRIRILIWERGVGPTTASGTGACASAVAAATYGGAGRAMDVISPGGSQHVEWADDGIYLTGWAEITTRGEWRGN